MRLRIYLPEQESSQLSIVCQNILHIFTAHANQLVIRELWVKTHSSQMNIYSSQQSFDFTPE